MHYQDPSTSIRYDDVTLKEELERFGFTPGPIVASTRNLYIKKLEKLKKEVKIVNKSANRKSLKVNFKPQKGSTCSTSITTTPIVELKTFEINVKPIENSTKSLHMESPGELEKSCTYDCVNKSSGSHETLKVNRRQPSKCITSLPSATIVTIDLTKDNLNTEPVVESTINLRMDALGEMKIGFKYDDGNKSNPQANINQPKACTCSTPSNDTLEAELKSFGYNPGPIVDSTKNVYMKKLQRLKQGLKCDKKEKLGRSFKALKNNVKQSKKRTSGSRTTISTRCKCNPEPIEESRVVRGSNRGSKCDNLDQSTHPRKTLQETKKCTCSDSNPSPNTSMAELTKLNSEPIVHNTRSTVMKGLEELKKVIECDNVDKLSCPLKASKVIIKQPTKESCRGQIEKYLLNADWMRDLRRFIRLEKEARQSFTDASKEWSGGNSKKSLSYLLLDPRVTKNLPVKMTKSNKNLQWTTFIESIFYVGTGENEGPYKHLIEAKPFWKNLMTSEDRKIQYILDIWKNNMGVICLQVFHNLIPVEAYTYKAAMIEVLGLKNLTNLTSGSYKGVVESWIEKKRNMLGVFLLYKAMQNYLNEGERQLRPEDL